LSFSFCFLETKTTPSQALDTGQNGTDRGIGQVDRRNGERKLRIVLYGSSILADHPFDRWDRIGSLGRSEKAGLRRFQGRGLWDFALFFDPAFVLDNQELQLI